MLHETAEEDIVQVINCFVQVNKQGGQDVYSQNVNWLLQDVIGAYNRLCLIAIYLMSSEQSKTE